MTSDPEKLAAELRAMPYRERLLAISHDIVSREDRFRAVNPHDLRELMLVPPPGPGGYWTYVRDTVEVDLREWAEANGALDDIEKAIAKVLKPEVVWKVMEAMDAIHEEREDASFDFLDAAEKECVVKAIMAQDLDDSDGGYVFARTSVVLPNGFEARFQGYIEDDGECIELLTPYDDRDGAFSELSDLAEEWNSVSWDGLSKDGWN